MSTLTINNLSLAGSTAANAIGAASGADTSAKLKTLLGTTDAELSQLENIVASGLDAVNDGTDYKRMSVAEKTQTDNIIASGLDAVSEGMVYGKVQIAKAVAINDETRLPTAVATTDANAIGAAPGTLVGNRLVSKITEAGYSLTPASGTATIDGIADGTSYVRIQKTYGDAINAGSYGLLYDGIEWDENADTYTRIGRTAGSPNYLEIQNGMRRCVVTASGEVAYYLYPTNSALKEDGVTASKLDGTDGQVMVEIPKFYHKYTYVGTKHSWKISSLKLPGFELYPLFKQGTTEMNQAFVGAFEGVLYDTTISGYVCGNGVEAGWAQFTTSGNVILCSGMTAPFENITIGAKIAVTGTVSNNGTFTIASGISNQSIAVVEALTDEIDTSCTIDVVRDVTATTGDKLGSVVGFSPITKITRAQARQLAKNMGANWSLLTYDMMSAIQLLYLIEYNSFYSQNKIGAGISNASNWTTYNNLYPLSKTGNSVSLGNATLNTGGATSAATEVSKHLTYRGIENSFGHIWKWVDGFNINNNIAYVNNNPATFVDNTATNYTSLGTMINVNGYQNTLLAISRGFLPKTVGSPGDATHKITNYYYQSTGWRVSRVGGSALDGSVDGFFCWRCDTSSAASDRAIGARLGLTK